ncbi:MAG: hypothetical protein M3145_09715, partial [Pseudomonadota bacterium]|nr:hypothetical protein [Pseudomonadota bacterium]
MLRAAGFKADGLPDASEGAVPALLAVRNLWKGGVRVEIGLARGKGYANLELVLALKIGSENEFERQIAALMCSDQLAVQAHFGQMVYRTEA